MKKKKKKKKNLIPLWSGDDASPVEKRVGARSVVHLIQQYLRENGLGESLAALQRETGVLLPGVPASELAALAGDARAGKWDKVLRAVAPRAARKRREDAARADLYELAAEGQWVAAEAFAQESPVLIAMRDAEPQRYAQILRVLGSGPAELLRGGLSKSSAVAASSASCAGGALALGADPARRRARREEIAASLRDALETVPESRLLLRLGQSLKWQQYQGLLPWSSASYDLFAGSDGGAPGRRDKEDRRPRKLLGKARLGKKSYPLCVAFSPDGNWLVTGSVDGFVEVWDSATCKHRMDLDYQTREELMLHERGGVMCAAFSPPILSFCVRVAQGETSRCGARVLGGYWSHSQERTK